ncbi:hypothetical protein LHK_01899 [Laribacter hongkongensis HLHK9]|uniref:Uncharacterized protein n=1 Tax=Laribacter hongkongensis (strain HLHK9) TaxID=557598 RepID=C1D8U3_LARHH|nr:hypothetical protein LHK_01899 [Laribacter hongkongensis HLHK9]
MYYIRFLVHGRIFVDVFCNVYAIFIHKIHVHHIDIHCE